MGRIWVPGGIGGGIDLDVITANPADVRAGKVIVDKDGEPLTGTLPDRGSWGVAELAAGASVTIPSGIHDGTGKIVAKSLADQTPGNLAAGNMLSGAYGYSNGVRVNGGIASMGAQTVTPGAAVQKVSCRGKYMTGDVTVQAVAGLAAANIKKGVTVGGVTGTWEGWVSSVDDVYNHGAWGFGGCLTPISSNAVVLQSDRIDLSAARQCAFATANAVDLKRYTRLTIEGTNLQGNMAVTVTAGRYAANSAEYKATVIDDVTIVSGQAIPFSCGYNYQIRINFRPIGSTVVSGRCIYKITLS